MPTTNNTNAPGNVNTGYRSDGLTTLVWGTGNSINSGYIVVSIDESEKTETYYVENGTGIEAARVMLNQGRRWNVTCIDDNSISPPVFGSTVQLWTHSLQSSNANALATAVVINNDVRAARKTEGQRVLQCEKLTLVDT